MKRSEEEDIRQVIDALDNFVDDKDWQRAAALFTETISVDLSALGGGAPAEIPSATLINSWKANLFTDKKSFHIRGNHSVTVNGHLATDVSKAYAINTLDVESIKGVWEIWATYRYTLIRENTAWRITGILLEVTQTRGDDRIRTYMPGQ